MLVFTLLSSSALILAQDSRMIKGKTIRVPFDASNFDTSERTTTFLKFEGRQVMKIGQSPSRQTIPVTLKKLTFTSGTIEFDGRPADNNFEDEIGINFHQRDRYNYESLYLRTQTDETVQRNNAIQYAPFIHGVNLWDIMKPYRGYAEIYNDRWNHFKLVISGRQMFVYINSNVPTLKVSRLEGNFASGAISFDGNAMFANLVIQPGVTADLSPAEGLDWTDNDPNYLRKWHVSEPHNLSKNQELTTDDLPADSTHWALIRSERRGLINLSRQFQGPELTSYPKSRRYVWLKTNIRSNRKQNVRMQLGFNKEVYVFINRKPLFFDKNEAGQAYQKFPGGLLDIANIAFQLPLTEGNNELLIGIAVQNYGWGIVARIESLQDLFIDK